ncbi:MAG: hypothetical protein AAF351_11610 [Pseudomonadota bacterium]
MSKFRNYLSSLVVLLALPLAACNGDDESSVAATSDSALLEYIPANASYALVSTEPPPEDVIEALQPLNEQIMKGYHDLLTAVGDGILAEAEGSDADGAEKVSAMFDEVASLLSADGLEDAGVQLYGDFALYGHGILPVMRFELADHEKFEATLDRLEESAEAKMSVKTIDGNAVRYGGDDELNFFVAVLENQAVVSMAPASFDDDQLGELLGFTKPSTSIVDSGELDGIVEKYGYNYMMIGYLDVVDIANFLVGNNSGLDQSLHALFAADDEHLASISDVCKAEIVEMAGVMPRIVTGYTELSETAMRSEAVFELRSDIAADMSGMTAEVPGMGTDPGGAMSFGMSLNLMGTRDFIANRIKAIEADPFECPDLQEVNAGVAEMKAGLEAPIPPFLIGLKGIFVDFEDIEGLDLATQTPPTSIDARILLAVDNAPAVLGMASMFSPELAGMNLEPNGEPQLMESMMTAMAPGPMYAAMTSDAISVSIGEGQQDKLGDMMAADNGGDDLIMSFAMDAARYYEFIGEVITTMDTEEAAANPEVNASVGEMMTVFADYLDRMQMDVRATEDGVQLDSIVTLKPQ